MNLLINAYSIDWTTEGGNAGYVYKLAQKLSINKINVYLITSEEKDNIYVQNLLKSGVKIFSIPLNQRCTRNFQYFIQSTYLSYKIHKKYNIDVIHAHGLYTGLSGGIIKKINNIPLIVTFHGFGLEEKIVKYYTIIRRKILAILCDIIIVLNENQREYFIKFIKNKDKIIKIYTAVDLNEFLIETNKEGIYNKYNINKNKRIILTLSIINKRKNISLLIRSFNILIKNNIQVHLIIAGIGPELKNLKKIVKKYNLENDITFTGLLLNRNEVIDLLKNSDIFVLTSLEEGLPLTILEAMAAKTPVITTKVGALPEIIENENNGILVNFDETELANKILLLFNNKNLIEKITNNAYKKLSDSFSWDTISVKMIRIYSLIIKNKLKS